MSDCLKIDINNCSIHLQTCQINRDEIDSEETLFDHMLKQFAEVLLSQLKQIDEVLDKIYSDTCIIAKDYISILTKCLTKTKMCGGGAGRNMSSPKFTFCQQGSSLSSRKGMK